MIIHVHKVVTNIDLDGQTIYTFAWPKQLKIIHSYDSSRQYVQEFHSTYTAIKQSENTLTIIDQSGNPVFHFDLSDYKYEVNIFNEEDCILIQFNINPDDVGSSADKCFRKMKDGDYSI